MKRFVSRELTLTRDATGRAARTALWPIVATKLRKNAWGEWIQRRPIEDKTMHQRLHALADDLGIGPGECAVVKLVLVKKGATP